MSSVTEMERPRWREDGVVVPGQSLEKFAALDPAEIPSGELRRVTLLRAGCGSKGLQWVMTRVLPPGRYGGGRYLRVAPVSGREQAPLELADTALRLHGWHAFVPWFCLEVTPAEGPWRGHRLYEGMWEAFVCRSVDLR